MHADRREFVQERDVSPELFGGELPAVLGKVSSGRPKMAAVTTYGYVLGGHQVCHAGR